MNNCAGNNAGLYGLLCIGVYKMHDEYACKINLITFSYH